MRVLLGESLRSCNSLALASRASAVARVTTDDELRHACSWAVDRGLPLIPLGEGSNVVLAGDLDALVVRQESKGIEQLNDGAGQVKLRIAAGENWHALVRWTLQQGLYGLQNLALIPGKVGAAPIQNIGAYGVELASVVQAVHAVTVPDARPIVLSATDCEFGYRDSVFKHALQDKVVITALDLCLSQSPCVDIGYPALADFLAEKGVASPTPEDVFEAVVSIRRSKLPDPAVEPNAGSFFKNPLLDAQQAKELTRRFSSLPTYPQEDGRVKLPAAWLIDYCGWKGFRKDNIGIHPHHALVVVNYGNDSGACLLSLAREVAASVADTFGVKLAIEPRIYGWHDDRF